MIYRDSIEIEKTDFERINKLFCVNFNDRDCNGNWTAPTKRLIKETKASQNSNPYGFEFMFNNGTHICIDIYSGDANYYDECQWFDCNYNKSLQLDCKLHLAKENQFIINGDTYVCTFIIKED